MEGLPPVIREPEVKVKQLFINNEWTDSSDGKTFDKVNPVTEELICKVSAATTDDIDKAVKAARAAFQPSSPWTKMGFTGRSALMEKLAELIMRDVQYIASLECMDVGKSYTNAFGEVAWGSQTMKYYSSISNHIFGQAKKAEMPFDNNQYFTYSQYQPLGVCGLILPWNFPFLLTMFKLGPCLAAGNTIILKPSEVTPLTGMYMSKLIKEAGFPPGVVNIVPGLGPVAGQAMSEHMDINKISFTGSVVTGRRIMEGSSKSNLKRITLELGGKSPLLIMPGANLKDACQIGCDAFNFNTGQICISPSRVYVHKDIYEEVKAAYVIDSGKRVAADPRELTTQSGPLVSQQHYNKVMGMIEDAKKAGAKMLCGGERIGKKGYYVQSTVFTDVTPDMAICRDEVFGPVVCLIKVDSLEEALEKANDSTYGLAAGVQTENLGEAFLAADGLQAGSVWVNCYGKTNTSMPFGGWKQSGIGFEGGVDGVKNFMTLKMVMMKYPEAKC